MSDSGQTGVLIVDPDSRERGRLKRELEACGWKVWDAPDASTAIRVYEERQHEICAAVVDLQLPGLQGCRVLAGLAAITPSLVRFAMFANLTPYAAAAFRRMSHTPLLSKPVRVQELDSALRDPRAVPV